MARWIQVARAAELPEGAMKKVTVDGRSLLIARLGGRLYAVDNTCTHLGGDLSLGKLEDTVVTCPRHGSRFDLKDGSVKAWTPELPGIITVLTKLVKPPTPLAVYTIKSVADNIEIEVES